MFGYVVPEADSLSEEEKSRFTACYCGLCRSIGRRHGPIARLTLTYDLAFLILLLESMYEPECSCRMRRCPVHPFRKRPCGSSAAADYAADMNVLLSWWKCLDDWQDDRSLRGLIMYRLLGRRAKKLQRQYPRQSEVIREELKKLSSCEDDPDAAAGCFGRLMGAVFAWREDYWTPSIVRLGERLGRFIYIMDACLDYDEDVKKGRPNPLRGLSEQRCEENDYELLSIMMNDVVKEFEHLPLEKDMHLLRNILYAGVWQRFRAHYHRDERKQKRQAEQ